MIDGDRARRDAVDQRTIQRLADAVTGHAGADFYQRTLATPLVDHRQEAKRVTIRERVMDEIHVPALGGTGRLRRRAAG
jgi:hypothetical protein